MHLQADQANGVYRSPVFAAYHAQRLHELHARLEYLCNTAWDVNCAWLLRHDLGVLLQQVGEVEPELDVTALLALGDAMGAALGQSTAPDDESLATLRALRDMLIPPQGANWMSSREVLYSENGRVELAPVGFWRRWTDDAKAPAWSDAESARGDGDDREDTFGFGNLDVDALMAGGAGARLEIVHERIASEFLERPEVAPDFEPPDDFIDAEETTASGEYDWSLDTSGSRQAAPDRSLDAFFDVTRESAPATESTPATPAPAVEQQSDVAPAPATPSPAAAPAAAVARPVPTTAAVPSLVPSLASGSGKRIYHLTESGELACELDQRLEALGYELELLENADELREMLGALTPDIVLVDAEFESELESLGKALRTARQKAIEPIRLLVICGSDTMAARLAARRGGADALMFDPQSSDEVLVRIEQMLRADADSRYRILIVEDDRAQGLFAESILRNAGMEAEVVEDGLKVMDALHRFQPDLVLMDLYMPDCDGAELTALIRERDEFVHTPIVFLSGEVDEDKHYEALSAGGDDFLSKPIRPKHLISAVTNRVRRARSIRQRSAQAARPEPFDSGTGLHFRAAMLERLEQALVQTEPSQRRGGVMFLGVEDVPALRQRLGLTTAEELLEDAAQFVVGQLGNGTMACRYGDGCFLIFDAEADAGQLRANAEQLREAVRLHTFETPREQINLRMAVGVADLRLPYADAVAVLNAAEHASRDAESEAQPVAILPEPGAVDPDRKNRLLAMLGGEPDPTRLDLDFQPIVALQGGEQAQYQTLLRLRGPDGSVVAARELLPVLRESGRLAEFDRWVLVRALEVIAKRLAMARPVTLFVNQSIEALCGEGYGRWLAEKLGGPGQLGESLVIEVDADEIGLSLDTVQSVCADLVMRGVRFCLNRYRGSEDQEGMLHVLPIDLVKFAPDIIAGLGASERRSGFNALVDHVHERALGVIAPRVEDTRTAAVLWMSGIDYIQGNLVQSAGHSLDFDFDAAVL